MAIFVKKESNYMNKLSKLENEILMGKILKYFEEKLIEKLNLTKLICPIILNQDLHYNDELDGELKPITTNINNINIEIVQSTVKWKRKMIDEYEFKENTGLIVDEVDIRPEEKIDYLHSYVVRQWDWEKKINPKDKNIKYLIECVNDIYNVIKDTEDYLYKFNNAYIPKLPNNITFITSDDLQKQYPKNTPDEREKIAAQKYGAVFIMQIGYPLMDGIRHSRRSADYDDWTLNGDIIVDFPEINDCIELSSMGIRVDKNTLVSQLESVNEMNKLQYPYYKDIINDSFSDCIGGGIGQSRLLMFLLKKKHIGETVSSVWDDYNKKTAKKNDLYLL